MKPKHIILIAAIIFSGILAFSCYQSSRAFRFSGDRGEIYETWETANDAFKIRITAYYEVGIYMPGAFFICESAPIGSNEWREFKVYRVDDAIPILRQRFRFVNNQTTFYYTADDFVVTVDGGRTWKVWKPLLPQPDGKIVYWAFTEAHIEGDGTGQAKLARYDEQVKNRVEIEIRTENFGQTWSVVKS